MVNTGRRAFILAILVPAGLAVLANWLSLEARDCPADMMNNLEIIKVRGLSLSARDCPPSGPDGPWMIEFGELTLEAGEVPRRKAAEIVLPANLEDAAVLGRPAAMVLSSDGLYIADALDCAIKVFSVDGRFSRSFGRKGSGPGELNFPSGVAVGESGIAVADKFNLRVQIFDRDGRPRGGYRLPFPPDRIFALGPDRLLVTTNPTGRKAGEKLLHVFDLAGREIWAGLDALASADPLLDAFRNMIIVCPDGANGVFVIHRSGERTIARFSASGALLGTLAVDGRHASRTVDLASGGRAVRLTGFCWAAAFDKDRFYLTAPEVLAGRDLGPGRSVSVLDAAGRLLATVDLPCPVHRFAVSEGRMFAVDDESALRIFEVGR